MNQILLVEDNIMFGRITKTTLEREFDRPVYWVKTFKETVQLLEQADNNFYMALLDLNLPDAPNGEVIDLVVNKGITSFVFTSNMRNSVREQVWSKKVADYILKDDPNSLGYVIEAIKRLVINQQSLILVVDDTKFFRTQLTELLYVQKYNVLNAKNGYEALELLQTYPDIKLVITDYDMPKMDGFQLCQKIRTKFSREDLAIIGISSNKDHGVGARFIKNGANDFIIKQSYLVEEFYSRVNHSIETIDLYRKIKETAIKDFLTGLYNRRYFFDAGEKLFSDSKDKQRSLVCAMIDIDFFKKINDSYGHDVGDLVIQQVATSINKRMGTTDIVARFGGEEFCILALNMERSEAQKVFTDLCHHIKTTPIIFNNNQQKVHVSVSIGVCTDETEDLEQMTKLADKNLYLAKQSGRNCVRMSKSTKQSL